VGCGHNPRLGAWDADFHGGSAPTLSQTISTIPGHDYEFSFWLRPGVIPNSFQASFGGTTVLTLTDAPSSGYIFERFIVAATSAATTIAFTATGAIVGADWSLDRVSVQDVGTSSPER